MEPDRIRAEEPDSVRQRAHAPAETTATTDDPANAILAGGNQMVARLVEGESRGLPGDDVADRIRGQLGSGSPLPTQLRTQMESGLGQSLGDVRLHTDATAANLSNQLGAHAFTTGNDVFFNTGAYNPDSTEGYQTLAHELTHTLQQSAGPVAGAEVSPGLAVSDPHDHDEQAAHATAERMTAKRENQ
ncbi:DUF4157 domain-containing protein [Kibdelosporangium phytohabitans]|uniref:eCIS core domain-containing protein n=1 Tax=Kibdelosporangium phytohabitans TaxID=860235 RepID=A0A0N9IEH6_9PSEU|nr:DUF4157 domain-containing protein [Kibdelosporangium phytohabitans]ALG13813.1 hypothetical protein AOZ06_49330 [Kibdelosporangium phytohabitans]MBE1467260.1 hypothetical protein [Kibdelosporangium phytohabitans]